MNVKKQRRFDRRMALDPDLYDAMKAALKAWMKADLTDNSTARAERMREARLLTGKAVDRGLLR